MTRAMQAATEVTAGEVPERSASPGTLGYFDERKEKEADDDQLI
jgi:hypothetical protein